MNILPLIYHKKQILYAHFSKMYVCLLILIWNIKSGKNNKFIGIPVFYKVNNSKLEWGDNNTFLSMRNSNLIGINRNCIISLFQENAEIMIGNNCGFSGVTISSCNQIIIEDNVKVGANCIITDHDWHSEDSRNNNSKKILIEENVWVGVNSIILKGVHIGKNSIIGAGSIVTSNIPANVVAAGNPCRVIKSIT